MSYQALAVFVEEVTDQLAIRLWKQPHMGLSPGQIDRLGAYLTQHLRSIVWSLRCQSRHQSNLEGWERFESPCECVPGLSEEDRQSLLEAIEALDEEEQYVVLFRYRLSWTVEQTARGLGMSMAKVKRRTQSGLEALRDRVRVMDA